ncbi:MAG: hypothetical protein HYV35_09865 [Lentisphaerae bacterium]|nr:hypothetical protein [Lentisphaerota bacterium]
MKKYQVDDLGVQARSDMWMLFRPGKDPRTGAEVVLGSLSLGGFMLIDPAAQTNFQVLPGRRIPNGGWWPVGQAPDGAIYQTGVFACKPPVPLLRWKGQGNHSEVAADLPGNSFFGLDISPDGVVYLPDSGQNVLYAFHPDTGQVENLGDFFRFGTHVRNVFCARDGWVYVFATDYKCSVVVALDPKTKEKKDLAELAGKSAAGLSLTGITKDAAGHVLVPQRRWGLDHWFELLGGKPTPIDPMKIRLARTETGYSPLAFSDGSYVLPPVDIGVDVSVVKADGARCAFKVARQESPLRIFSVYAGGGKIWGGTFIPLTLFAFDPATSQTEFFGNPTEVNGEIYTMAFSRDKLFLGSYPQAVLTRYQPGKGWKRDKSISANPAHLGRVKEEGLYLHRPYGVAQDAMGRIYFAALGGYGCEDSGVCRIDPATEEITRWIYPGTTFSVMTYLPGRDQLVMVELRKGEQKTIRLTFLDPHNGKIVDSRPVIYDEGAITSLLADGGDLIYGMHAHRAALFAYSLKAGKIVKTIPEMGLGDNCFNCLIFGPDGRIWGLTVKCVFAADRDLSGFEVVAEYPDQAGLHCYRFGLAQGPDGHVYFPNGPHLMRIRAV